jgi:hypothetical protein
MQNQSPYTFAPRQLPIKTDGVAANQWHEAKIEVTKKTATAYINGEQKWSIDASDIPNGRIGIGGYQDRESHFDDVEVYGPK